MTDDLSEFEGDWYGLYKGSTSQDEYLFTKESTRHPAKMSLPLVNRIIDSMLAAGWISEGSLLVDPFGGRGTSILAWLARHPANRGFSLELEPHFVEMQQKNKAHAERRLHRDLAWVILQGDSRWFDEYYAEGKAASILSAPYGPQEANGKGYSDPSLRIGNERYGHKDTVTEGLQSGDWKYGETPGQIGNLPDSAITSAPYSQDGQPGRAGSRKREMERPAADRIGSSCWNDEGYGHSDGQIGDLPDPPAASVLSAPYENSTQPGGGEKGARGGDSMRRIKRDYIEPSAAVLSAPYAAAENRRAAGKVQEGEVSDAITRAYDATNHGQTAGNIANLPDACVTSAPYEDQPPGIAPNAENKRGGLGQAFREGRITERNMHVGYTDSAAAVTSAPFEDSLASDDPEKRGGFLKSDPKRRNDPGLTATYTDAAAVTSAPYDGLHVGGKGGEGPGAAGHEEERKRIAAGCPTEHAGMATRAGYGDTAANTEQGQIGVLQTSDARMLEILGARRSTKCQTATKISDAEIAASSATVGDAKPAGGSIPTDSLEQPSTISASGMHSADDQDSINRGRAPRTGKAATGDGEGTDTSGSTTSLKSGTTTPAATAEQPGIQPESQSITSSLGKTAGRQSSKTSSPSVTPATSTDTRPNPESISVSSAEQSTCQREPSPDPAQNPARPDSTPPNTAAGSQRSDQPEDYALACAKVYASLAKAGIRYVASVTKDPTGQPKGIKFCKCGKEKK